jgi:hypothetical protein
MKQLPQNAQELVEYLGDGWTVWVPEPWPDYLGDLGPTAGDERVGAQKEGWAVFIEYFETDGTLYQGELAGIDNTGYLDTPEEVLRNLERTREIVIEKAQKRLAQWQQIKTLAELSATSTQGSGSAPHLAAGTTCHGR